MNVRHRRFVAWKQNCKFHSVPVPSLFTHFEMNIYSTGPRIKGGGGGSRDRVPVSPVLFPWHLTAPCALGSTQPLKMSTRLILGVMAAGA
jgi:hypothetical protein